MRIIGDGGHAKVVRDVISKMPVSFGDGWVFVAVGNNRDRKNEVERNPGKYPVLIHPSAVIGSHVDIGEGTIVMAGVVIQPYTRIGRHCIINTSSSLDHECTLEDFVHIAPGVRLCGGVKVGEGALVGVGSVAVPLSVIKPWELIKAGSVCKTRIKLPETLNKL